MDTREKRRMYHFHKMLRARLKLSYLLLSILIIGNAESKFNFEKFILTEHIEEKFTLLSSKQLLQNYEFNESASSENSSCARDLVLYKEAIVDREDWALQMLDASSKVPSGILGGNFIDLGSYDQCLKASGSYRGIEIRGHHCTFTVNPSQPFNDFLFKPMMSVCLPHTCTYTDLANLVNGTLRVSTRLKELNATLGTARCAIREPYVWNTFSVLWYFSVAYFAFIILCTLSDLVGRISPCNEQASAVRRVLQKFSVIKSAESIFNLELRDTSLSIIHGLRLFCSIGLVFLHHSLFQLFASNINNLEIYEVSLPKILTINAAAVFFVDVFFVISGFLTTLAVLKNAGNKKTFNIFLFYLHRYIRLTPSILPALFFFTPIMLASLSGPRSNIIAEIFLKNFDSKIWSFFLYIQNFVQSRSTGLLHLWYVAVDMQFYWFSPLILLPLLKKPKLGLKILFSLLAISIISSSFIIVKYKYPSFIELDKMNMTHLIFMFDTYYQAPNVRASSWLLGALLGYVVATDNFKLSKRSVYIGWILGIASFLFSIFGYLHLTSKNYEYNVLFEGAFGAFGRPAWAFGVCWIIYACLLNPTGLLSRFLSWKYFIPFSRISYSLYIVHFVIISMRVQTSRSPLYYGVFQIFHSFTADLVLSLMLAFISAVLFEAPALSINDIIFKLVKKTGAPKEKAN